jgi:tetratricopeptide (TPR) repeat protein
MSHHVFVAMPYGIKQGVNFNEVYRQLIKPALEAVGFSVFRADEEQRAGSISTDMFQELLLADLVVADLSIDNPNVWYELGVRHALRARGVIQIQSQRERMPFDVYVERTLRYHLKDGLPDPLHLEEDKRALARFAQETLNSWYKLRVSPVYHLLPFLAEPDWKSLRVGKAQQLWEEHEAWERRIEVARRNSRPGDILVYVDEVPTQYLRAEAYRAAGNALLTLGQFKFALEQYEKALDADPTEIYSARQKGIALGRLGKHEEAKIWLEALLIRHPEDAEAWGLLGRVRKDEWTAAWRRPDRSVEEMKRDARAAEGLLLQAIDAYLTGYRKNPQNYYPGINALTLIHLHKHLTGKHRPADERKMLEGALRWNISSAISRNGNDYWARVSLGDVEVLTGKVARVEEAYRRAVAVAERRWFWLDSSRQQLLLLKDLGFCPDAVGVALKIFDSELTGLIPPWWPRRTFLFSGHMIDKPEREPPRFPADREEVAAKAIAGKLEALATGPDDLAVCGGACGGDILFAAACLQRGMRLQVCLPLEEPAFLQASVSCAGDNWRDRYYRMKENPLTTLRLMPQELGATPKGMSPFARNNLWQLYTALAYGPEKVHFICLWNRQEGDGPGGTRHMYETVSQRSGQVHVLDTNQLW